MSNLMKTRSVLEHQPHAGSPELVVFTGPNDEGDESRGHILSVNREVWDEMGSPEAITVTIEPGDLLNGEED